MAQDEQKGYFFISYSHEDREVVLPVLQEMENQGLTFWYDKDLHLGGAFDEEIANMISECEIFLFFVSDHSVASDYVGDEFAYARNLQKPIIVYHLHAAVDVPMWMQLRSGRLHQLHAYLDSIPGNVAKIKTAQDDHLIQNSDPISQGIRNHFSDLLKACREEFDLLTNQMGIPDVEQAIDPDYFCPITDPDNRMIKLLHEVQKSDDNKHILLQADGGQGKTSQFLYAMYYMLKFDRPCAYIPCHLFSVSEKKELGYILDMLILMYFPGKKWTEGELKEFFRGQTDRKFVLFLDGFNETVVKADLSEELIRLSNTFPNIKIVVSSRSYDPAFSGYSLLSMSGLNENKVREILLQKKKNYDAMDNNLRKVLLTPMFLRLYIHADTTKREIDTAAELMDLERQRILKNTTVAKSTESEFKTECLNQVFPDFVRQEYCANDRQMSFYQEHLLNYLKDRFPTENTAKKLFDFLTDNSVIMKMDDRTHKYAYRHEHYRDYWVAYSVFSMLAGCLGRYSGESRAMVIISVLDQPYSDTVLRYIGELAQIHPDNHGVLGQVLDCLRRSKVENDQLWLDTKTAEATAKLIWILKLMLEDNLIGADLSELNLSETQLNQVRTCSRKEKASFCGALIEEDTFVVSMHESAPRRVEILRLEEKNYLVTVSNHDLLISTLPDLESVWRYSHTDTEGKPVSTQVLVSSVMLENCMIAVDSDHNTWKWTFAMRDGIPCISSMHRIAKKLQAVKVFPWSDQGGPLAGLQCTDGVIWLLALQPVHDSPEMQCTETHVPGIPPVENTLETLTPKTLTPSPDHTCFYWATGGGEGGIHVWRYDTDDRFSQEICHIPDKNLLPDYMICAGIEQASRKNTRLDFGASNQDGSVLILSAICEKHTRVYQIRPSLTGASNAEYTVLTWPDNELYLKNDYTKTERKYNRINASSFSGDKLVLAASDGSLYHFEWNQEKACYMPDSGKSTVSLTAPTFAIEDVLYVSSDAIAAVSVDRFVYLLEAKSLTPIKKLKGYNDGLRHLLLKNDNLILATSYDGNVLELSRTGDRFVCKDKITVGDWVWSLEIIHSSVCAAGYRSGLALVDIKTDSILWHKAGLPYKVEHLLYLPDRDQTLLCANKSGVQIYKVCDGAGGRMHLEEAGYLNLPGNHACYWLVRKDDTLYASVNEGSDKHPRIACFDLTRPLEEQQPVMIETGVPFGRIRDIHCLGNYLIAPGPTTEDKVGKTSCVCFIRLRDGEDTTVDHLPDTYESFIAHSALQRIGESNSWRFAVIDSKTDGNLCQYILTEAKEGALKTVKHSCCVFNTKLNEVAFDSRGDLLLACMDGHLYLKPWEDDVPRPLFRNKSYMLTFGADMSGLYEPVRPESPLGIILADFGNRLEMTQRGNTII